jgi:MinD-like ATPase involved in chromosome partitioning or flagellar assembly
VHSYKGGTGKTLLSVNLAATFVKQGKNVCLIDLDFRAPSVFSILKAKNATCWFNDYLNSVCEVNQSLIDLSSSIPGTGKFFVGFANPSTGAIRDMLIKDRGWEMKALGRLLALRRTLLDSGAVDYIVFDTSPGLQFSSINAIVAADLMIVVTTGDRSDVEGTRRMLTGLYKLFGKKTGIIMNKMSSASFSEASLNMRLANSEISLYPSIVGILPCFCDILKAEGKSLFTIENPNHPFTLILQEITKNIEVLMHDFSNTRDTLREQNAEPKKVETKFAGS